MNHSGHGTSTVAANDGDSARQVADLAALRRMLVVSEGCFSLSFAVCNDRTLRNELIDRLRAEFAGVVIVELAAETPDVYQAVRKQLPGGAPCAIFVLDLEASLPSESKAYPTLRALNRSRELWEQLTCPVVFWLAEYAAALVARHAPDFWRYRSHQFEFVSDRVTVREAIREPFPGFEMVDALPFEEKRFRVAELEARLREAGTPPSSEVLPHALQWLYELAHLYRHISEFDRARELLDRAVSWSESAYGPDDPRIAVALGNLAQVLQVTSRPAEAEPLMRRAIAMTEQRFGNDHPHVATCLNNLAGLLQDMNRLDEAEPLIQRALAIDERSLGTDHGNVARDLNNLAQLLQDTNRMADAEPLMRRALAIDEQSFGKDHHRVAIELNTLTQLLLATNRQAEAEPFIRRALAIDERCFGKDHPNIAIRLNNLARLLQDTNRLVEAEPLMRRALAVAEQSLGKEHPNVAIYLNNLAVLLQRTKRLAEAEPLMRRVAGILLDFNRQTGHPHPHLEDAIRNYELLLQAMGMSEQEIKQRLDAMQHAIR